MCLPPSAATHESIVEKRQQKAIVDEEIRVLKAQITALQSEVPKRIILPRNSICSNGGTVGDSVASPQRTSLPHSERQQRLFVAKKVGRKLGIGADIVEAQSRLPPVLTGVAPDLWQTRVVRTSKNPPKAKANRALFADCIRKDPKAMGNGWKRCTTHLPGDCASLSQAHTNPDSHKLRLPHFSCEQPCRTLHTDMIMITTEEHDPVLESLYPPTSKILSCGPPSYTPRITLQTSNNKTTAANCLLGTSTASDSACNRSSSLPCLRTGRGAILRDCAFIMMPEAL